MDKHLNEAEQRLLELVESTSFDQLSKEEKTFVLKHMSKEEYELRTIVLREGKNAYESLEPRKLLLEEEEKRGMLIPIPLYQTVGAVAAAFLIAFFLFKQSPEEIINSEAVPLAKVDTVYVEKVLHDTVVQYKTEYIDRVIREQISRNAEVIVESRERGSSMSSQSPSMPDLVEINLKNKGKSMQDDETLELVQGLAIPN